jgi:hypothetical protein
MPLLGVEEKSTMDRFLNDPFTVSLLNISYNFTIRSPSPSILLTESL